MTAETLKPFIAPQNVESCPTAQSGTATKKHQRKINVLTIGLSTVTLVLLIAVAVYTIWLSTRIHHTETENARLNRMINVMRNRLGLHYLDDIEDFEKRYANALIEDPSSLDDLEGNYDDDDDDDFFDKKDSKLSKNHKGKDSSEDDDDSNEYGKMKNYDYDINAFVKKINGYEDDDDDDDDDDDEDNDEVTANTHDDNSSTSEDYNLYGDFEKFQDSKKKKDNARAIRSITQSPNDFSSYESAPIVSKNVQEHMERPQPENTELPIHNTQNRMESLRKSGFIADRTKNQRHTLLRQRAHRQRKIPVVRSGESLVSAKYVTSITSQATSSPLNSIKPAAHFHLNRKVPERHGAIRVDSYPGDMYIGHHPSWSNEAATEHYFSIQNGVLTVREPGLYYVYAQICYNNTHDQNGFVIFHGHKPFLQCLNTVPTNLPLKIHTCHTSGLIYLRENETIHLRDFHSDRNVILKDSNNRSYFGLIKV